MNIYQLTVIADYYCEVYIDGLLTSVAKKDDPLTIEISAGPHDIKWVCTTDKKVYIEQAIYIKEDVTLQISFADLLFAHPELIVTVSNFICYYYNLKRFHDVWKDIEIVDQGSRWNGYNVPIGEHIEVIKDGKRCYVNQIAEPAKTKSVIPEAVAEVEENVVALPYKYDKVGPFNCDRACVLIDDKWKIVNREGELIVPFDLDFCSLYMQDQCIISCGGKMGVIDIDGKVIIPCEYDRITRSNFDRNNSATLQVEWEIDEETGDYSNKFITPSFYSYNNYYVKKYDKWGVYDLNGTCVLPYIYDDFVCFDDLIVGIVHKENKIYLSSTCVSFVCNQYNLITKDYILIQSEGGWELYRTTGEIALDDKFEEYKYLGYNLLVVRKEGLYALYNLQTQQYVSKFEYDTVYNFFEERATVVKNGLHGFIDTDGVEVIPCQYGGAWMFVDGIAEVEEDIIDKYGHHIGPTELPE